MAKKEDGPLISIAFKGFALLSGAFALWNFAKGFMPVTDPVQSPAVISSFVSAAVFFGNGLFLWWMGEVAQWLWEIAKNTKQGVAAVAERPAVRRSEQPAPFRKIEQPPATQDDPPRYQL